MSGHPSLAGAGAGRGTRRLLGAVLAASLALAVALAIAVPARAATQTFPANGGFDGSAAGWSSSESCGGLASALLCTVSSSYAGGDGAPPGSIEFSASTVLSVNALNDLVGELLSPTALNSLLRGLIQPSGLLGGLLGSGGLLGIGDLVAELGLPLQLDLAGVNQLLGGLGLPVVSDGGLNDLIGLLGIVVLPVEPRGTWTSPEFTHSGGAPLAVTFSYDRRALIGPLVNLGGSARTQAVLVNITNGTERVLVDETFSAANGSFASRTVGVPTTAITPGSRYRIELRTRFSSLVAVLATSRMQYDNVRLSVFDGTGDGNGGGQGGTGAGGLGACTADLSRPAVAGGGARGNPERVTLSRQQLLINQRISQAGVRRVNTVIDKLTAGLTANDFRDCSIGPVDFDPLLVQNTITGAPAIPPTGAAAARPTPRRPSGGGDPARVTLSRQQLLINQRISQAAVRRVNAIRERLNGNITAGDIRNGAISAAKLDTEGRFTFNRALPAGGTASTAFRPLQLRNLGRGNPARVTLSRQQLLINQRISQAAVRRINQVNAELRQGLTGVNVRDGSLARATLSPGIQSGTGG